MSLHMSNYHIVGNHMSWLICVFFKWEVRILRSHEGVLYFAVLLHKSILEDQLLNVSAFKLLINLVAKKR